MKTENLTCHYTSEADAPAGALCGNLISENGKFLGQIRKTESDEFTVYGWNGVVGKFKKVDFRFIGFDRLTSKKSIREYTFRSNATCQPAHS